MYSDAIVHSPNTLTNSTKNYGSTSKYTRGENYGTKERKITEYFIGARFPQ